MIDSALLSVDEATDRILAMRAQEETGYAYRHYFPMGPNGEVDRRINVSWREKIVTWSYNVIDQ